MEHELIDIFDKEITCAYRGEIYQIRDNGAIFRHARKNQRLRPKDEKWTFGTINKQKGYLNFASEAVHRIVATAFLGEPPSDKHVVDHIDTNKQNNRPENLRWVTRLENILLNPISLSRILYLYGSIDNFLSDPSKPLNGTLDQNFDWMRTVTKEESENTKTNLLNWAKEGKIPKGGSLGDWVYYRIEVHSEERIEEVFRQVEKKTGISRQALCFNKAKRGNHYDARIYAAKLLDAELSLSEYEIGKLMGLSPTTVNLYLEISADRYSGDYEEVRERQFEKRFEITPENYIQKNWAAQSDFHLCPQEVFDDPIAEYAEQIKANELFFQTSYYHTTIIQSEIIDQGGLLLVLYEISYKDREDRWGIMKITFENEKFVHEIIPNYNGTLDHYFLIDTKNHFYSIVNGTEWSPLYDSQGREFREGYMPL
ncbi:MAG: HNH endonuclease [Bacteroidota bacterium]